MAPVADSLHPMRLIPTPSKPMSCSLQEIDSRWCHQSLCLVLTIDVYATGLTCTLHCAAMTPSTGVSANGSKILSSLLMNSGFKR